MKNKMSRIYLVISLSVMLVACSPGDSAEEVNHRPKIVEKPSDEDRQSTSDRKPIAVTHQVFNIATPRLVLKPANNPSGTSQVYLQHRPGSIAVPLATVDHLFAEKVFVPAQYINGNLYLVKTIYDADGYSDRTLWKVDSDKNEHQINNTTDIMDFRVAPDERYVAVHLMQNDGIFLILSSSGEKIEQLTNSESGTEQSIDGRLIGWASEGDYFYYHDGRSVLRTTAPDWKAEVVSPRVKSDSNEEIYNLQGGLVAYDGKPNLIGLEGSALDEVKDRVTPVYVTKLKGGPSIKLTEVKGTDFTLVWLSEKQLAVVDDHTGKYRVVDVNHDELHE